MYSEVLLMNITTKKLFTVAPIDNMECAVN